MANTNYTSLGQMVKAGDYEALKNYLEAQNEKALKAFEEINPQGLREIDALLFHSMKYTNERQLDIMELLIKFGANPNVSNKDQVTILMQACGANNVEAVKALLKQDGIDVNKKDGSAVWDAGHYAVNADAVEAFAELVNAGLDPKAVSTMNGRSYLHYAASEGFDKMCDALIAYGVDPTVEEKIDDCIAAEFVPNDEQFTPLLEKLEEYRTQFKGTKSDFDFSSSF